MNQELQLIETVCKTSAQTLNDVASSCSNFPSIKWEFSGYDIPWEAGKAEFDIRFSHPNNPFYEALFLEIEKKKFKGSPVLYWFTITTPFDYDDLVSQYETQLDALGRLPQNAGRRSLSAIRRKKEYQNYLYCGKVKKDFDLRMVVHLGYAKNGQTGGLQLCRWLPQHFPEMRIKLVAYKFPHEMQDLMGALEYQMAQYLKPIIGKHT